MKIKFDKELGLKNLDEQNKIPNTELSVLHFNDYYDGPLEGLCRWYDEKYYFLWTGEMSDDDEIVRRYFVFRLTSDQLKKEEHRHNLFEEAKKQNKLEEFYKIQDEEAAFDAAQLVGWTEDLPHGKDSV